MIILMRHGETEHKDGFYGSTDSQLTDTGIATMLAQASAISFDGVICSPLQRCRLVAEQLARQQQCQQHLLPEWREYHFGDWEQQAIEQLWQKQPQNLEAFWQNPHHFTPPNAEPFANFLQRIQQGMQQVIALSDNHQHLLVITHAGVIRALRLLSQQTTPDQWLTYPVAHASLHLFDKETAHVDPFMA